MYINGLVMKVRSKFAKCVHLTLTPEEQGSKKWLWSGSVVHRMLNEDFT